MPMLLLSIPGFVGLWRRDRSEAALFLVLTAAYLAVAAFKVITLVRYVTPVLPFLFLPLALVTGRRWADGLLAVLVPVSLARVIYHTNVYYGRSLDNPFPYLGEWPSLLLVLVPAAVTLAIVRRRRATLAST
jgi:hypothetical protein